MSKLLRGSLQRMLLRSASSGGRNRALLSQLQTAAATLQGRSYYLDDGATTIRGRTLSSSALMANNNNNSDHADILQVSKDGSKIELGLHGSASLFHASWLWSNDPSQVHATSGQRLRSPSTYFTAQPRIRAAEIIIAAQEEDGQKDDDDHLPSQPIHGSLHPVGGIYTIERNDVDEEIMEESESGMGTNDRQVLAVTWDVMTPGGTEGIHDSTCVSYYDLDWLYRCRYDQDALIERRAETVVTKEHALKAGFAVQNLNYHALMTNDERDSCLYDFLHAVIEEGAALVSCAPVPQMTHHGGEEETAPVAKVGKLLGGGSLSHGSLYDNVFHVETVPGALNIAYTTEALAPHQDLSYYESPPGLQLLHCLQSDGTTGGESLLVDALAAAHEFRSLAPDLFDVLTRCEATFLKQRKGADMVYRRPHIQLEASGFDIVSVHWSPPFMGPLAIDPDMVEDYFVAYAAFERMLDNSLPRLSKILSDSHGHRLLPMLPKPLEVNLCDYAHEYTWEHPLQPGEMLVFNNERMLHGRRGFVVDDKDGRNRRHLMGCYTNIDDTLNMYRILRRQRFLDSKELPYIRLAGNGSSSSH